MRTNHNREYSGKGKFTQSYQHLTSVIDSVRQELDSRAPDSLDLPGGLYDLSLIIKHSVHLVSADGISGRRRQLLVSLPGRRRRRLPTRRLLLADETQSPLLTAHDLIHLPVELAHRVVNLTLAVEDLAQLARGLRVVFVVLVVVLGVRVLPAVAGGVGGCGSQGYVTHGTVLTATYEESRNCGVTK